MQIKVRYLGLISKKVGKREEELEIKGDCTLSQLLDELAKIYGENLKPLFEAEKGNIMDPTFIVTVNGILANRLEGMGTRLKNGDEVSMMTLISGG